MAKKVVADHGPELPRKRELSEAEQRYINFTHDLHVKKKYGDTEAAERFWAEKHPEYKFNGIATEINYGDKD